MPRPKPPPPLRLSLGQKATLLDACAALDGCCAKLLESHRLALAVLARLAGSKAARALREELRLAEEVHRAAGAAYRATRKNVKEKVLS